MKRIETFDDIRDKQLGATNGEEQDIRNDVLDDMGSKINEIVDWINKQEEDLK